MPDLIPFSDLEAQEILAIDEVVYLRDVALSLLKRSASHPDRISSNIKYHTVFDLIEYATLTAFIGNTPPHMQDELKSKVTDAIDDLAHDLQQFDSSWLWLTTELYKSASCLADLIGGNERASADTFDEFIGRYAFVKLTEIQPRALKILQDAEEAV